MQLTAACSLFIHKALTLELNAVTHAMQPRHVFLLLLAEKLFMRSGAAMQAQYCQCAIRLTLTRLCPSLCRYSDPHSVLSAGPQSRLCHQYWKAGGCRGIERGNGFLFIVGFFYLHVFRLLSWCHPLMQHDSELRGSHIAGRCSVTGCIMLYALIHSAPFSQLNSLNVHFSNPTLSLQCVSVLRGMPL